MTDETAVGRMGFWGTKLQLSRDCDYERIYFSKIQKLLRHIMLRERDGSEGHAVPQHQRKKVDSRSTRPSTVARRSALLTLKRLNRRHKGSRSSDHPSARSCSTKKAVPNAKR